MRNGQCTLAKWPLIAAGPAAALAIVLLLAGDVRRSLASGGDSGIDGPFAGLPAAPTRVDLRSVPADGGRPRPSKPRLHPAGEAELEREKAAAEQGNVPAPRASPMATTTLALTPGIGFDGIDSAASFCGCIPPDGAVAAGRAHLLAAVNTAFKVWDKQGTLRRLPKELGKPAQQPGVSA